MSGEAEDDFARQLEELVKEYSSESQQDGGERAKPEAEIILDKKPEETPTLAPREISISENDGLGEVLARLESRLVDLAGLRPLFGAMHTELKTYKDDFLFDSLQRPLIADLISLQDDLRAVLEQIDPKAKPGALKKRQKAGQNLENSLAFLAEILGRLGVEELSVAGEKAFDPMWQRIVSTVPVSEVNNEGDVEEVTRSGFRWRGRILRPMDVVVARTAKQVTG